MFKTAQEAHDMLPFNAPDITEKDKEHLVQIAKETELETLKERRASIITSRRIDGKTLNKKEMDAALKVLEAGEAYIRLRTVYLILKLTCKNYDTKPEFSRDASLAAATEDAFNVLDDFVNLNPQHQINLELFKRYI